jgi:hypothetical protein
VCSPPANPPQTHPRFLPITKKSQLNDTSTAVSAYTCSCAIVTRARPRDFPNAIGAPARISQPVISTVHGFVLKLTLDALYGVDVHWPRLTPCPASRRWTSGRRRIWARRHGSSETRCCCIYLRFQRTFDAEEVLRLLDLLSRVVPGSGAGVLHAIVEFAEVFAQISWGLNRACA